MICAEVREHLAEFALGTLDPGTRSRVEQHLAWCAGCRKEAEELRTGVAGLALSLPRVDPPDHLEDRVVSAVTTRARAPHKRRGLAAALLAAVVAGSSVAWGLAVAGRDEPVDPRQAAREALADIRGAEQIFGLGGNTGVESARLRAVGGGPAGGGAIRYDAPDADGDLLVVLVGGLREDAGPYTVTVRSAGARMVVGPLDPMGSGRWGLGREFFRDLSGFDEIVVEDARGRPVLVGTFTD
jgi:hypothetical protein